MLDKGHHHEPGVWKQKNKSHRSIGHRSKREVNTQNKGRVSVKVVSKKPKHLLQREERRNYQKQIRLQKREQVLNFKRSVGVGQSPPHLTVIIPLHQYVDVPSLSQIIKHCIAVDDAIPSASPLQSAGFTANIPRLKHRFQFIEPGSPSFDDILNSALVADSVIFLVSCDDAEPIDEHGCNVLSCLLTQGISSMVFCTQGIKNLAVKMRNSVKKEIMRKLEQYISNSKLYAADEEHEIFNLLRTVAETKRQKIGIRHNRPYMLVEKQEFVINEDDDVGTLKVCGHIRGAALDVNQLIHVVGWGDYQISRIEEVAEHCPWNPRRNTLKSKESIEDDKVTIQGKSFRVWEPTGKFLESNPALQQDVTSLAEVDLMDGEQTWPTEEEIQEAEENAQVTTKLKKKVPEGTSEYQAAWILDDEEDWEDVESDEESMEEDLVPECEEVSQVDEGSMIMMSESVMSESPSLMDVADDPASVALFREERSHEMFPDEIDTPNDVPARTRFQKFRGLQSFRTSSWDPKENLPLDYAKIFQFQSFQRTKKRMKSAIPDETASFKAGTYVTVHLKNVPRSHVTGHPGCSPLTFFGLFAHEQKMSVLHLAVKQTNSQTIKNKSELLFYVGFRRFRAKPIFSEHTTGSKHKMMRFLPKEGVSIASVYAPIIFPPANAVIFREENGERHLVASGALYKVDPDRIVTKRIVLSGHPYRIHKRGAVVRYMFFNREDVLWFKPVELKTKYGRRGHIREPLGTHGHMKCVFDDQLISQDTVLMSLYKRVFPPWTYEPVTPLNSATRGDDDESFNEELFE